MPAVQAVKGSSLEVSKVAWAPKVRSFQPVLADAVTVGEAVKPTSPLIVRWGR